MLEDNRTTRQIVLDQARDAAGLLAISLLGWGLIAWAIALKPVVIPV